MTEFVYWIKRKHHNDPYMEGYVGVSGDPYRRFSEHVNSTENPHLYRAMRHSDDIELCILHECTTRENALLEEFKYRPDYNIGWNINRGGAEPPRNHLTEDVRKKISSAHKARGTNPYCNNTHSPSAIAKRKASMSGRSWFYNPETGEQRNVKECPAGWLQGRKYKKPEQPIKVAGVDYVAHVASWTVVDPGGNKYQIYNLKKWCRDKGIAYLTVYGSRLGWKAQKLEQK